MRFLLTKIKIYKDQILDFLLPKLPMLHREYLIFDFEYINPLREKFTSNLTWTICEICLAWSSSSTCKFDLMPLMKKGCKYFLALSAPHKKNPMLTRQKFFCAPKYYITPLALLICLQQYNLVSWLYHHVPILVQPWNWISMNSFSFSIT